MIRRFGQRVERGIAACAENFRAGGVHRVDTAFEAAAMQIAPHTPRPVPRAIRGTDQHDVAGIEELIDHDGIGFLGLGFGGHCSDIPIP